MKIYKYKKAQALVETALVLPVILLLLFGIIEFGRILNTYILITNASREGARYYVVDYTTKDWNTRKMNAKDAAIDRLEGSLQSINDPNIFSINIEKVDETGTADPNGENVKVALDYKLALITPIVRNLVSQTGTLDLQSSTIMRIE